MKLTFVVLAAVCLALAAGCDRRAEPENRPEPQPSNTADAPAASQSAPSGEVPTPVDEPTPVEEPGAEQAGDPVED